MKTDKNILIAFILNLSFSIFEFIGGALTGSVAISSDAVHDIGDAISIGISFFLEKISKKKPDEHYTYGYIKYSVMGSIITTVVLLVGSILVIYSSINRIINPVEINYNGMIMFAIIGVIVNVLASFITRKGDSLNQKSVNLHMLEDVLGWIVVLIGSIFMRFTDIKILDALLSIVVALFILLGTLKNLKEVLDLFLEKTPSDISIEEIKKHLLKIKGVVDVHHIHIRSMEGFSNIATLHVVVDTNNHNIRHQIKDELSELGISHSTVEIEFGDEKCLDHECEIKPVIETHHHH